VVVVERGEVGRSRGRARGDVALVLGALGLVFAFQRLEPRAVGGQQREPVERDAENDGDERVEDRVSSEPAHSYSRSSYRRVAGAISSVKSKRRMPGTELSKRSPLS